MKVGDRVRIERDETRWPSKGTWPRYRGKVGVVSSVNGDAGEIGVRFTRSTNEHPTWFLPHELVVVFEAAETPSAALEAA